MALSTPEASPDQAASLAPQLVRRYRRGWRPLRSLTAQGSNEPQRRGMFMFLLDGVLANLGESFVGPYLTLYLLALGANGQQVGLLAAATGLVGALMLLPGARLASTMPSYRRVVVATSLLARAMLPLMLVVPWVASGQPAIAAIIILAALRTAANQLGVPAWTAFSAIIVPTELRGRYFATRTAAMSLAALVAVPVAGRLISALGSPQGYQASLGLAFSVGILASWSYSRIPLLPVARTEANVQPSLRAALGVLGRQPAFLRLCLTAIVLNLGVQLVGPFFNVHIVRGMGADASFIGITATVSAALDLVGQRFFGPFVDRRGLRRTLVITTPLLSLIPFAWLFARTPLQVLPISALAGFAWAGYRLASFNYLLASTPDDQRPLYSAIFNTGNAVATMVGPLIGGGLFDAWGFHVCAAASVLGRGTAAILTLLLIRELGERTARPAAAC